MEHPDRQRPSMPNDSAGRYWHGEEPGYPGFHTYATSDLYDTNGEAQRWPDNWEHPGDHGHDFGSDDEPAVKRDYWGAMLWTMSWYAVPGLILILRALLPGERDRSRTATVADLIANSPAWLVALACGLILALVLRWASASWRGATIGFCAAVVSGGAITVLYRIW